MNLALLMILATKHYDSAEIQKITKKQQSYVLYFVKMKGEK